MMFCSQEGPFERGLDALLAHGRPSSVKLLVLVDRRFQRELPH